MIGGRGARHESERGYSGFQKNPSWPLSQQSLCFFFGFVPEHRLGGSMGERRVCHKVLLTNWSLSILQWLYSFLHGSQNKTLSFENMFKSIQGRHSGLLVCSFLKDRLVRSRASEDGIRGAPLTYSLLADPIAEPGEGPWAGGRQLPHLFPESALELSPAFWCHRGPCKENGTGWDVAEENSSGNSVQTQAGRGEYICVWLQPLKTLASGFPQTWV